MDSLLSVIIEGVSSLESEISLHNYVFLEKTLISDTDIIYAIKKLNLVVKHLNDLSDANNLDKNDILVTAHFEEIASKRPSFKILGRPALLELAVSPNGLQGINRHRYCNALVGAIVSVTGIQKRDEMARLLSLIRWMGGSFRENINHKTTFLVSGYACSAKSQYAYLHEIPVVNSSWLYEAWKRRDELGFLATNSAFVSDHKLKPFHGAKICFTGFTEEERTHMIDVLLQNGGTPVDENDAECTHLVTKEGFAYVSSPLIDRDSKVTSCLRGVLAPKNLIKTLEKEDILSTSPNTRNGGLKRTLSMTDGNNLHEIKKKRFLNPDNNVHLFKHPNPLSTHLEHSPNNNLVVNESSIDTIPLVKNNNAEVVKEAWFWTSVQYQSCALIKEYFLTNLNVSNTPTSALSSTLTMSSSSRTRKRKRQLDRFSTLLKSSPTTSTTLGETSPNNCSAPSKRRSSAANTLDGLRLSCGSFLNFTNSPDPSPFKHPKEPDAISKDKPFSPRYQVFSELLQTEINYVGVLNTIITVYKEPLEEMVDKEDYLLNNTEIKIIFGNVLPIYQVHQEMLEELKCLAATWQEDSSIGSVFLKYSNELVKAYPPFVNFFEKTREMLLQCDQTKPRFHAFLKVGQTRPECCRQSLQELLIRPVQRLPSISLLLNDILKHSEKNNPDHIALVSALASIREVMTHINEDKRRTEGQVVLFDIFNEIDNCPPHLVSSHRSFITKCDVIELSDNLSGRGDHLTIFVFSDIVEVCKKRKCFNGKSPKEPNSGSHKLNGAKLYKHIKLMPLNIIKQVIDIKETDDCRNTFSLMIIDNHDFQERLYTFTLTGSNCNTNSKNLFLKNISQQVANTNCSGNILISLDSQQLDIDTSEITTGTLGKAFKFASKTRIKVGRALSFNKTPSKLKRAVSTMMSPVLSLTNNVPGTHALTPSTQLANMHLASCTTLNEMSTNHSYHSPPMSVQPTRKNKTSILSLSSTPR
ncbi:protein ECT2 isoform X2 [Daktulosphaira vitifoliae]|uniref:protein ECT2 isoform X2 n=1 Tax=Daktulosphaira vitifoliae TaxID=58002 RepID=UPI0021AAA881|nr:protein ECT2 isoform X2 [Daktulosphaira vitifoliae]